MAIGHGAAARVATAPMGQLGWAASAGMKVPEERRRPRSRSCADVAPHAAALARRGAMAGPSIASGGAPMEDGPGGWRGWALFIPLATALFLMNGSFSVVMTVLPEIAEDLGAPLADSIWVTIATTLFTTGLLPAAGMLGDVLGHERVWLFGMVLRVCCLLLSGFAPNLAVLVVSRALSSVGGALDEPSGTAMTLRAFPREQRPFFLGISTAIMAAAQPLGLLVGGVVAEHFGWRWLFLGPAVPLVFVLAGTTWLLKSRFSPLRPARGGFVRLPTDEAEAEPPSAERSHGADRFEKLRRFDWGGTALLVGSISLLLLTGNRVPVDGLGSPLVLCGLGLGLVLLLGFYHVERRAAQPILPPALLGFAPVAATLLAYPLLWAAYLAVWLFLPLYLKNVMLVAEDEAAALMSLRPTMNALFNTLGGALQRRGTNFLTLILVGSALLHAGYWVMQAFVAEGVGAAGGVKPKAMALLMSFQALMGSGLGLIYNSTMSFVLDSGAQDKLANSLGILRTVQQCSILAGYIATEAIIGEDTPDGATAVDVAPYERCAKVILVVSGLFLLYPAWMVGYTMGRAKEGGGAGGAEKAAEKAAGARGGAKVAEAAEA